MDPYCVDEENTLSCDGSELTCEELRARQFAIEGAYQHAFKARIPQKTDSIILDLLECHSSIVAEHRARPDRCGLSPCEEFCRLSPCADSCDERCQEVLDAYDEETLWDAIVGLSKVGPILRNCSSSDCGGGAAGNTCCLIQGCNGDE